MNVSGKADTIQKAGAWGRFRHWWSCCLEDEAVLGYLLLVPTILTVLGIVGYPFLMSIFYSFTDKAVGAAEINFIGFDNYASLIKDRIYRKAFVNTFNFTVTAVIVKILLGLVMALTLNEIRWFRRFFRAAFLLPWVMPTALSVLGWLWMFDPQFSVITYILKLTGLFDLVKTVGILKPLATSIPWKADPQLAMASVQTVNIWRGTPFFGMMILASLMTVPKELYEAARVDGANWIQRFWYVTIPFILPVLLVALLFSFVRTMGDFQIVWILTNGGPFDSTQLIATRAYQVAIQGAKETGLGAAVAVSLFPFILPVMILYLRSLRQRSEV
jgi:multiple sugar transport system permease protein